jgi:hypothetical protein
LTEFNFIEEAETALVSEEVINLTAPTLYIPEQEADKILFVL